MNPRALLRIRHGVPALCEIVPANDGECVPCGRSRCPTVQATGHTVPDPRRRWRSRFGKVPLTYCTSARHRKNNGPALAMGAVHVPGHGVHAMCRTEINPIF